MPQLVQGSQGKEVRQLQTLLNEVLDDTPALKVDGIFGPKTGARVVAFQKQAQLAPDGVVGPKTNKALVSAVLAANLKSWYTLPPDPIKEGQGGTRPRPACHLSPAFRQEPSVKSHAILLSPAGSSSLNAYNQAIGRI